MKEEAFRFGEFSVSPSDRRLARGSESLALPPKAFDALMLLVRRNGTLVSREEIVRTLWPTVHVTEANLTNIIVLLRKALGSGAIQTMSKHGYRLTMPVTGEPEPTTSAYASFARGKELLAERSLEAIERARELLWLSLAQDPHFAAGWAWLGRACHLQGKLKRGDKMGAELAEAAFQRAFALEPELACAHQFYTQVQVDRGNAAMAMTRLGQRIRERGEEPETLTGLVQVLRYCGLLTESVEADRRARKLDPAAKTSVAHTLFLQCEYASVFERYEGKGFYLDSATWAALGETGRAIQLLQTRLAEPSLGPIMTNMMGSLLGILKGQREEAMRLMEEAAIYPEPEMMFYLARHCGMLGEGLATVAMLKRARAGGFWSATTLEQDVVFALVRGLDGFQEELRVVKGLELQARRVFQEAVGESW